MNTLAQLVIPSKSAPAFQNYKTLVGDIVSRLLLYAIAAAGMYFFVKLVIAGFTYLTSLGDPGKVQAAQQTLAHALIGLIIVITAFFLAQIVELIFGIKILTI